MKSSEIREMSAVEIKKLVRETRAELLDMRMKKASGQLEDSSAISKAKRDVARMLTILTEKDKTAAAAEAETAA